MKFIISLKDDIETSYDLSSRITPPVISETNRTQSVKYTIGGAAVVDRISNALKHRIELTIPVIPNDEWEKIKTILCEMSFMVYWDNKGYEMRLSGDLPTPVITAYQDSYIAGDIKLELEEM